MFRKLLQITWTNSCLWQMQIARESRNLETRFWRSNVNGNLPNKRDWLLPKRVQVQTENFSNKRIIDYVFLAARERNFIVCALFPNLEPFQNDSTIFLMTPERFSNVSGGNVNEWIIGLILFRILNQIKSRLLLVKKFIQGRASDIKATAIVRSGRNKQLQYNLICQQNQLKFVS